MRWNVALNIKIQTFEQLLVVVVFNPHPCRKYTGVDACASGLHLGKQKQNCITKCILHYCLYNQNTLLNFSFLFFFA